MSVDRKSKILLFGLTAVLAGLVAGVATGVLGPRAFSAACVAAIVIAWFAYWGVNRALGGGADNLMRADCAGDARVKLAPRLILILIILPLAFWAGRGGPLLPQFVGATVLVAFLLGPLLPRKR